MADVSVRPARPADAERIARVQLATWRTAYARLLPPAALEVPEVQAAALWLGAIERPPSPEHRVLVALERDELVGVAAGGPVVAGELAKTGAGPGRAAAQGDTGPGAAAPAAGATGLGGDAGPGEAPDGAVGASGSGGDAGAGEPAEPSARGPVVELSTLLVDPRWGRRGHGSRLLAASVDGWRTSGAGTALCWALERDEATRSFLVAAGWEPDGARRTLGDGPDGAGEVRQLRLHTDLRADTTG